jgi:hypothetical protein
MPKNEIEDKKTQKKGKKKSKKKLLNQEYENIKDSPLGF